MIPRSIQPGQLVCFRKLILEDKVDMIMGLSTPESRWPVFLLLSSLRFPILAEVL